MKSGALNLVSIYCRTSATRSDMHFSYNHLFEVSLISQGFDNRLSEDNNISLLNLYFVVKFVHSPADKHDILEELFKL